jgi:hypothetical protein
MFHHFLLFHWYLMFHHYRRCPLCHYFPMNLNFLKSPMFHHYRQFH